MNEPNAQPRFDEWCIVELFGHQRIAGRVSEQQIGGCNFVRVDVPATDHLPAMTKFLGQGAIYAITPVAEALARAAAARFCPEPVQRWDLPRLEAVTEPADDDDDDDADEL